MNRPCSRPLTEKASLKPAGMCCSWPGPRIPSIPRLLLHGSGRDRGEPCPVRDSSVSGVLRGGHCGQSRSLPQDETVPAHWPSVPWRICWPVGPDRLVVLGPGLSPSEETRELIRRLCEHLEKPLLLNGDVLAGGDGDLGVIRRQGDPRSGSPTSRDVSTLPSGPWAKTRADSLGSVQALCKNSVPSWSSGESRPHRPSERRPFSSTPSTVSSGPDAGWCNVLPGSSVPSAARLARGRSGPDSRLSYTVSQVIWQLKKESGQAGITARQLVSGVPGAIKAFREDYPGVTANYQGAVEVI